MCLTNHRQQQQRYSFLAQNVVLFPQRQRFAVFGVEINFNTNWMVNLSLQINLKLKTLIYF